MTRAMLAAVLWRQAGSPAVNYLMSFSDVVQGVYYEDAVAWASENGIITGYGNGLFGVDDPVTREQLAAILWRYAGEPAHERDAFGSFPDWRDIFSYALDAALWAQEKGIMDGVDGNRFDPKSSATRAQVAVILYRYLNGSANEPSVPFEDLPTYEYEAQEIRLENDGQMIYGIAYIPQTAEEKVPLVISSHGLGGSYRSNFAYAERLATHGLAVYCFDFRGGGGSNSEGSTTQMSVMTEVSDLEVILEAAKGWDFVDTDRIVLHGTSQGGIVSAIVAARHPDEIAGLILCYPAFLVSDSVHEMFDSLDEVPDSYQFNWITAGRPYAADMWDYDVYSEIGTYDKKLMHGDADSIVPSSYSERAESVYADVDYFVIEGAGHGFNGSSFEEAIQHIFDYLQESGILKTDTQPSQNTTASRLKVTIGDTVGYIELNNNTTTKAFLELLPLTITMQDLHGREYWFSHSLPYDEQDVVHDYAPGQLTYWCGGWVTAYYDRDDDSVIEAGSVGIGIMDQNLVDAFHSLNGRTESVTFAMAS